MGKVIRYEEKYDPNHSQECICHRSPMCRGLEESLEGSYVDYEEYEKLKQRCAELDSKINQSYNSFIKGVELGLFYDGDNALKKFAIEQKVEALDDLLEEIKCSVVVPKRYEQLQEPYLEGIKHCIQFIECQLEQLRKEQDK